MWKKVFAIIIVLAIFVTVVLTTIPLKDETYTVMESYQDIETYWDRVEQPLSYMKTQSHAETGISLSLGIIAEAYVSIQNIDTVPGTFDVNFTFIALNRTFHDTDRLYIEPGETKIAYGMADTDLGEDWKWSYDIVPGTKIVDVQKQRTVWKERPVIKTRRVPLINFD